MKWSIGLRVPGATLVDVNAAFDRGELVRSWTMRGTLHAVAAEDLAWILSLTGERTLKSMSRRRQELGMDLSTVEQAREVVVEALRGGRSLTRHALFAELDSRGISTEGGRGYHLLVALSVSGTVCLGPMEGADQAVVLGDEWIDAPRTLERDEALGEFARRYFTGHGPATLADFANWTKLPKSDCNIGLGLAGEGLEELVVEDVSYWMAGGLADPGSASAPTRRVHLLPGFDEYLLGYRDRGAALDDGHRAAIVPGNNGMFRPSVVAGGRVVATWRREVRAKEVRLRVEPLGGAPKIGAKQLAEPAEAYGRFLGLPTAIG